MTPQSVFFFPRWNLGTVSHCQCIFQKLFHTTGFFLSTHHKSSGGPAATMVPSTRRTEDQSSTLNKYGMSLFDDSDFSKPNSNAWNKMLPDLWKRRSAPLRSPNTNCCFCHDTAISSIMGGYGLSQHLPLENL